eukprot:11955294-Prorocentrum_lima.AAC.1
MHPCLHSASTAGRKQKTTASNDARPATQSAPRGTVVPAALVGQERTPSSRFCSTGSKLLACTSSRA